MRNYGIVCKAVYDVSNGMNMKRKVLPHTASKISYHRHIYLMVFLGASIIYIGGLRDRGTGNILRWVTVIGRVLVIFSMQNLWADKKF